MSNRYFVGLPTRFRARDGARAFIKAELHEQSPL